MQAIRASWEAEVEAGTTSAGEKLPLQWNIFRASTIVRSMSGKDEL
jgi:hypothetical protein